ncbi:hypothetical protein BDN72DRAFT_845569 [Pluteus cervinus]|uniref:Uncharacterized protein n=1 Tax=Pluteus cervinus TaxID=181527 RepID=A0ACD3AJ73_9AGAR|nr:hypothetical protein BDN72DRAFT_845569 [Pluteus cervinus]
MVNSPQAPQEAATASRRGRRKRGQEQEAEQPAGSNSPPSTGTPDDVIASVLRRLGQMEIDLNKERDEKRKLEAKITQLLDDAGDEDEDDPSKVQHWEQKYLELEKLYTSLEKERNTEQRGRHSGGTPSTEEDMIPRPKGTAGKDFSIQVEMRLASSENKDEKYKAVLRSLHDLVLGARLEWTLPWKAISTGDKAKLFQVAREHHPILKRYTNDWATEELVKRFLKNRRSYHYARKWLVPPTKYAYLKANASNRKSNGSRVKRAKLELLAKKRGTGSRRTEPEDVDVEMGED